MAVGGLCTDQSTKIACGAVECRTEELGAWSCWLSPAAPSRARLRLRIARAASRSRVAVSRQSTAQSGLYITSSEDVTKSRNGERHSGTYAKLQYNNNRFVRTPKRTVRMEWRVRSRQWARPGRVRQVRARLRFPLARTMPSPSPACVKCAWHCRPAPRRRGRV